MKCERCKEETFNIGGFSCQSCNRVHDGTWCGACRHTHEQLIIACKKIPHHMMEALYFYVWYYAPIGDFMTALMSNNFIELVGRADEENIRYLTTWAEVIYNLLPSACHGSSEKVQAWLVQYTQNCSYYQRIRTSIGVA